MSHTVGRAEVAGKASFCARGVSRKSAGADPAAATSGGVRSVPLGRGQSGSWAGEDLADAASRGEPLHLGAGSST